MRILDRYILKSVISVFISCVFLFLFLYVIIDLLSNLGDMFKHHANLTLLFDYYISYLPVIFVQVSPFACLFSTVYTFAKLNHQNEIIAMRASGLSIMKISHNVLIFGFVVSLAVFWVSDKIVPGALIENEKIRDQMEGVSGKNKGEKSETLNNLSMYGLKNRLFFISKFNLSSRTMEGITILEQDENQNLTKKIVATKGVYEDGLWKFSRCITYNFNSNGQVIDEPVYMENEIMAIPETPADFANQRQKPELMSIRELLNYIWRLSRSGATSVIRNMKVELYERFTAPFTNLIIILLGIPFSFLMRKRATGLSSIGVSLVVGFLYYILNAFCLALGKTGWVLTPALAACASHFIVLSTSLYLISKLP